jgi:tetratricopeptide (TPR) repeat protein
MVADSITRKGINYIYNLEFENAEREFDILINRQPDQPAGYFFSAMIDWWRILINLDDESYDKGLKKKLEKVIDICDALLDKDEFNIVALFYKCGAIGFRGRLFTNRDSWLKAADDGRIAYPILMKAYKLAPTNNDILLGIGIYDYFAEVIPSQYSILRPIMFFFPKGNKARGIEELKMAWEKAYYSNVEAAYFLLQVYLNYENEPFKALEVALWLYNKYPNNTHFQRYLGRTFVKLGRWVDVGRTFSDILERVKNKQRGYTTVVEREALYYLGMFYMASGNWETALQYFYHCDELCRSLDKEKQSGYMVMTNLKVGMIYDIQNKRDLAIKQYKKVLDMTEFDQAQDLAKNYIKSPYRQY